MTDREQILEYLKDIPSKWRVGLADILCEIKESKNNPTCQDVKDCETLTSLSSFNISGNIVSITYKDEKGISYVRTFDLSDIINSSFDGLNPSCLTDSTTWSNLLFPQRIQLLIDKICTCCP